jgi:Tol biopolymer transport system component
MLSPDGRQVVTSISVPSKTGDVWIHDATGFDQSRRLTFDPAGADTPIWSRDGRWIAYSSARADGWGIFRKPADGSGEEERLFDADVGSWVGSFAPDDKSLIFERFTTGSSVDLWILPLDGERKAYPFLDTPSNEAHPMFSPDGRFVAYVSDEDGIGRVYVRSVTAATNRWQLSKGGGDWPAWSADGKELFFAGSDRMLYTVPISSASPLAFGEPQPLFRLRTHEPRISSYRTCYTPAPDGRRFLVNQLVGDERDTRIEVVTSWQPPEAAR